MTTTTVTTTTGIIIITITITIIVIIIIPNYIDIDVHFAHMNQLYNPVYTHCTHISMSEPIIKVTST